MNDSSTNRTHHNRVNPRTIFIGALILLFIATVCLVGKRRLSPNSDAPILPNRRLSAGAPAVLDSIGSEIGRSDGAGNGVKTITESGSPSDTILIVGDVQRSPLGTPLEGARVRFEYQPDSVPGDSARRALCAEAVTDATGLFHARATTLNSEDFWKSPLSRSSTRIRSVLEIVVGESLVYRSIEYGALAEMSDQALPQTIDVGTLQVDLGCDITGRLTSDNDQREQTPAALYISCDDPRIASFYLRTACPTGEVRADGSFSVRLPKRGIAPFESRIEGSTPMSALLIAVSSVSLGLEFVPLDHPDPHLEILMPPSAQLQVQVRDADDHPVSGARIAVIPLCEPYLDPHALHEHDQLSIIGRYLLLGADSKFGQLLVRTTDQGGDATMLLPARPQPHSLLLDYVDERKTEPLSYCFFVDAPGYLPELLSLPALPKGNGALVIHVNSSASSTSLVSGTIIDEEEERGLEGASLFLMGQQVATSGPQGEFAFSTKSPVVTQALLHAVAYGYLDTDVALPVNAGTTSTVPPIVMRRPSIVRGVVVDQYQAPVRGASVWIESEEVKQGRPDSTDKDGQFAVEADSGKAVFLRISPPPVDAWAEAERYPVRPGQVQLIHLTKLDGHATVIATVTDQSNKVAPTIESASLVYLQGKAGESRPSRACTISGARVQAESLFVGRWRLWIVLGDHPPMTYEFQVERDTKLIDAEIAIPPTSTIEGAVEFEGGGMTLPCGVSVRRPEESFLPADNILERRLHQGTYVDLGSDHKFRFAGVMPGIATLTLVSDYWIGVTTVSLTPGKLAHVSITAHPAGAIRFVIRSQHDCMARIEIAEGEAPWRELASMWVTADQADAHGIFKVSAGRLAWRVTFWGDSLSAENDLQNGYVKEGTVQVPLGGDVGVEVMCDKGN